MIVVYIGPHGVEKAFVHAESERAQDAALAVWPVVRNELKRLDRKLRHAEEKRPAVEQESRL